MNDDLISRQVAIDALEKGLPSEPLKSKYTEGITVGFGLAITWIKQLPSAQPERKKGTWIEKHHAYSDEESVIEEWQSCCCSECGRYDTRPYMYYFDEPNFCSYCGARMHERKDE